MPEKSTNRTSDRQTLPSVCTSATESISRNTSVRNQTVCTKSAAFAAGQSREAPISAANSLPTSAGRIQKPT